MLALKGAEIIFWPSAAMDYTGDLIESLVNARAVDNQVYFVPSHFLQMPYLVGKQAVNDGQPVNVAEAK